MVRWLSDLINLSCRLAIWRLGRMKLNCSQQNSIICILLVLKRFIMNRFATKSREFSWDLFRFNASKPYSRICRTSFALKFRPFDKVERCFDNVAQCSDNVASTLLLVWTGLYVSNVYTISAFHILYFYSLFLAFSTSLIILPNFTAMAWTVAWKWWFLIS